MESPSIPCPGAADTSMMRGGLTDEALEAFVSTIPLGRMAEPDEVASAVIFLPRIMRGISPGDDQRLWGTV